VTVADSLSRPPRSLGLTPLIDVVFILLIFFMLSTAFTRESGLTLAPERRASQAPTADRFIIAVAADGTVRLRGTALDLPQLAARLRPLLRVSPAPAVVVAAEDGAPWRLLVAAIDAAKAGGADRVSVRREARQ